MLLDLRKSRQDKRNAKVHEVNLRTKHLDDSAEQYVRDNTGAKKENIITQLKNIEIQIRSSKRIDYALNGRRSGALSYLLIPAPSAYSPQQPDNPSFDHTDINTIYSRISNVHNGKDVPEWEIINDRSQVERLTLECMQMHFAQADGTPFTATEWIAKLTDETIQNSILEGTFDTNPYPKPIRLYLNALKKDPKHKSLSISYSFEAIL